VYEIASIFEVLRDFKPSLVITDIDLHGAGGSEYRELEDGFKLCEKILSLHPQILVIGCTGHIDKSVRQRT
jgi:DNA-binding NarL/FixJ family response regulator